MFKQPPATSHSPSEQTAHVKGSAFSGRVALQQRVLPSYRVPFFDALAAACLGGLSVLSGQPCADESITTGNLQIAQQIRVRNRHLFTPASPLYLCWQAGLIRRLEAWQPEVLIVEANPRYCSTPAAVKWMRVRHRPVVGWGLGAPQPVGFLASRRLQGRIRFLSSFDALIAYSQRGAYEYQDLGFPAERVFVATNAVTPRPNLSSPNPPPILHRSPQRAICRSSANPQTDRPSHPGMRGLAGGDTTLLDHRWRWPCPARAPDSSPIGLPTSGIPW